ncbi:transcription factor Adf-1-like [Cololabis saira]|uniref:transcription factor Adf-1-like n=1 Tax=Cololabis saira TaxID=129043 RepID=UPI002AD2BE59|nr:transcription factor Adf-1-like [Cololabis saira]
MSGDDAEAATNHIQGIKQEDLDEAGEDDTKMEEKLIIAVAGFPELYDVTLFIYRDIRKKFEAWKKVSEIIGIPVADCRKRWKSFRDTYRRERKKQKERRESGSEASFHRPWRYSHMMGFLDPFLEEKGTCKNMPTSASQGQGDDAAGEEAASTSQDTEFLLLDPEPPSPSPSTCRDRARTRKRPHEGTLSAFERQLMAAVERVVSQSAPPDPDRLFFEGLLPDLKALSARRKAQIKFEIHRLIFEATCQQADEQQG